jgi:Insertion element 4 transposase N-terminal/Transposase DDE domain
LPRAGWVKPENDQRLSDHISIGVLTRTFPPELVDSIIAAAGRTERRSRLLPARVVVYYVLAMALFSQASYEEVMRSLVEGLAWADGWRGSWRMPTKAAIYKARARLGPEPLAALFAAVAGPVATPATPGAFYRGWRLMAIDGTTLDIADTPANAAAFGRPGTGRGSGVGGFPQLRLVGLAECGSHAIVAANMGPYTTGERELLEPVLDALGPGMLCLADRGFYGVALWNAARARGAELLWRARADQVLQPEVVFADGSWLTSLYAADDPGHRAPVPARVIAYALADPGRGGEPAYRLLTSILDPEAAPALDLARLYPERWEFEITLDELKTHQRGPRLVLRSKDPAGVAQEAYGYLCVHHAIRRLMQDAAQASARDPDRLSFTRTLRAARRTTASHPGFSPSGPG